MDPDIERSTEALLERAAEATTRYFHEAIATVEARLGEGAAARHPEFVAAYMLRAASEFEADRQRRRAAAN